MPVDHAICIVAYNSVSKQLLASNYQFFTKLSQSPHTHKNCNLKRIIGKR